MTAFLNENPGLDNLKNREIHHIKKYIVRLFENADQYFLLMTHKADSSNPQFKIYQDFCATTKYQCFYAISSGVPGAKEGDENDISTFSEYFLGYTSELAQDYEIPYLYFIDNTETFPSLKYKIKGPFENAGQMKRFKQAIADKEWENFYVSEPPISNPENGKNGVLAVTRENYKEIIKAHRGDVILMLVNSQHMG